MSLDTILSNALVIKIKSITSSIDVLEWFCEIRGWCELWDALAI